MFDTPTAFDSIHIHSVWLGKFHSVIVDVFMHMTLELSFNRKNKRKPFALRLFLKQCVIEKSISIRRNGIFLGGAEAVHYGFMDGLKGNAFASFRISI